MRYFSIAVLVGALTFTAGRVAAETFGDTPTPGLTGGGTITGQVLQTTYDPASTDYDDASLYINMPSTAAALDKAVAVGFNTAPQVALTRDGKIQWWNTSDNLSPAMGVASGALVLTVPGYAGNNLMSWNINTGAATSNFPFTTTSTLSAAGVTSTSTLTISGATVTTPQGDSFSSAVTNTMTTSVLTQTTHRFCSCTSGTNCPLIIGAPSLNGQVITIQQLSAQQCVLQASSGGTAAVLPAGAATLTLNANDSITMRYATSIGWVTQAYSDNSP